MKVIASTQKTGGLQIVDVKCCNTTLKQQVQRRCNKKYLFSKSYPFHQSNQSYHESSTSYVQKVIAFKLRNHQYMAIARKSGIVQLFRVDIFGEMFELVKEWKEGCFGPDDPIVSLQFVCGHLYSCSNQGKIVVRDLNEDDSETSYLVNTLRGPVSALAIHPHDFLIIATAGKGNDLELNDLSMTLNSSYTNNDIRTSVISDSIQRFLDRAERRETTRSDRPYAFCKRTSDPIWKSRISPEKYLYNIGKDIISSWICQIIFLSDVATEDDFPFTGRTGNRTAANNIYKLACATRFGSILIYEPGVSKFPTKDMTVSNYPINHLSRVPSHPDLLLFADSADKVGILNIKENKIVNQYRIKTGPISSLEILSSSLADTHMNNKITIEIMVCSFNQKVTLYKLTTGDNKSEALCHIQLDSLIPCFCVINDCLTNTVLDYQTFSENSAVISDIVNQDFKRQRTE